jgi:uncharacterized protein YgiM (DUF1202 family)
MVSRKIVYVGWLFGMILVFALTACNLSSQEASTPTPSSEQVLVTARAISPTPTLAPPTDTPGPPTETFTPEPTGTPSITTAVADYNANIRSGPGEEYEVIDFILAGEAGEIVGRYDDTPIGTWWLIQRFGEAGRDGWVWGGAVTLSGNEASVPVLEPPPTPAPTDEPPGPTPPPSETPTSSETPTPGPSSTPS